MPDDTTAATGDPPASHPNAIPDPAPEPDESPVPPEGFEPV
ncbi:hypothetical protein [Streptomyces sp. NPDC050738]